MASTEELRKRLDKAVDIGDTLERRLWSLAVITESLSVFGITPVLVGGAAVEFYTLGGYATKDIDVIVEPTQKFTEVMKQLGFEKKQSRFWVRDDIGLVLETPTGPLAGDPERIVKLNIDAMSICVIGIEDLIIDRLNAFVHWQSAEDGRWVSRLLGMQREIDWDYLNARATQENVDLALAGILNNIRDGKQQ